MGNLLQNVLVMHWMQTVGVLIFMIGILIGFSGWCWLLCRDLSYDPHFRECSWSKALFAGYLNPFAWLYVGIALLGLGQLLKWARDLGLLDPLSRAAFAMSGICVALLLYIMLGNLLARCTGSKRSVLSVLLVPVGMLAAVFLLVVGAVQFIRCGRWVCLIT